MEQFALMIYQGTTPLPGTDEWEALPKDEQTKVYADYASLNQTPGVTPGPPLGLPADARQPVRVAAGRRIHADRELGPGAATGGVTRWPQSGVRGYRCRRRVSDLAASD